MKYQFAPKFYFGIFLVFISLILGKITFFMFFYYLNHDFLRWTSIIVYIFSWLMLVIGVWWMGKEYAEAVKKYASYKFYHQSLKTGTRKAFKKTQVLKDKLMRNKNPNRSI